MRKLLLSLTIVGLFALAFVPAARATPTLSGSVTYYFTSCEVGGGCGTGTGTNGSYGSVTLTQYTNTDGSTYVDVSVSLESNAYFLLSGSGDNEYFKLVGATGKTSKYGGTLTASDFTNLSMGGSSTGLSVDTGSGVSGSSATQNLDGDGTGYFYFGITCSTCSTGGTGKVSGPLTFTVNNATIADLTVGNNKEIAFVADAYMPNTNTGPIDVPVPEPASLLLLGTGLLGLGGIGLRRKKGKGELKE